jgi:hypothetical protein
MEARATKLHAELESHKENNPEHFNQLSAYTEPPFSAWDLSGEAFLCVRAVVRERFRSSTERVSTRRALRWARCGDAPRHCCVAGRSRAAPVRRELQRMLIAVREVCASCRADSGSVEEGVE